MRRTSNISNKQEVIVESSWRYLIVFFLLILLVCMFFVYHYLGPKLDDLSNNRPQPTKSDKILSIEIGGTQFSIAEKYTVFPLDRDNGKKEKIYIYTLFPSMKGYSKSKHNQFLFNNKHNKRIDIIIAINYSKITEIEKIEKIYLPMLKDRQGDATDFNLQKFVFNPDISGTPANGYLNKELYLARTSNNKVFSIMCDAGNELKLYRSDCWREYDLTKYVNIRYSYSKLLLKDWQNINSKVEMLINSFLLSSKNS